MITENKATELGVTNGTTTEIASVHCTNDARENKIARVVYSTLQWKIRLTHWIFPNCTAGQLPIIQSSETLKINVIQDGRNEMISTQRWQIPLVPAYTIADYKAQGQTYDGAILDIDSSFTEQSPCVVLSRVRNPDNSFMLRPFPMSHITSRAKPSGDLKTEIQSQKRKMHDLQEVLESRKRIRQC